MSTPTMQMKKKKKTYKKTYQRGNIALMRRIHNQRATDDQVRAPHPVGPAQIEKFRIFRAILGLALETSENTESTACISCNAAA